MYYQQDDLEEIENEIRIKGQRSRPKPNKRLKKSGSQMRAEIAALPEFEKVPARPRPSEEEVFYSLVEEDSNRQAFNPTLGRIDGHTNHMSNHEREWILTYLGAFYNDHMITDVLRRVKAGKEATVYCCRADPKTGLELVAGKVYHERMFRSLKNDSLYREGRTVLDDQGKGVRGRREALAMAKKTRFGQDLRQVSWLTSEFQALQRLYEAGADIPRPVAQSDNAILMEYIGEEAWPAPALVQVTLQRDEARALFERLIWNIDLMLSLELVHGDLSAHNILYWDGKATLIDFPQAVNPYVNPSAYALLERDVLRVCQYFAKYGIAADAPGITYGMWNKYMPGG